MWLSKTNDQRWVVLVEYDKSEIKQDAQYLYDRIEDQAYLKNVLDRELPLATEVVAAHPKDAAAPAALIDRWPSLFAQPAGARCGLHVDAHGTHFWQAVVRGRKQWRIFPQSETARLYPHPPNRAWFGVPDAFAPDFATFPALAGARVLETELGEGELIFVPADSPHQVPERACEREHKFLVRITHTASQRPRNPQQPP